MEGEVIVTLEYLEKNARYYLLDMKLFTCVAVMEDYNNGVKGFSIRKRFQQGEGYYFDFENIWIGNSVIGEHLNFRRYKLTASYEKAFQHFNLFV